MVVLYCVVVFLEINRVRVNLFQLGTKEPVPLPEAAGPNIQLTEKLYVPVKDHPEVCIFDCYHHDFSIHANYTRNYLQFIYRIIPQLKVPWENFV